MLAGGRFYRETTTLLPVSGDGVIDLEILANELEKHHLGGWRPFVSLMAANNETGGIQPVAEASEIVHDAGGLLHSDAVQAAGRMTLDMTTLGADMLSLSAHKIGGPKGIGALVVKPRRLGRATAERAAAKSGGSALAPRTSPASSASASPPSLAAPILPTQGRSERSSAALEEGALAIAPEAVILSGAASAAREYELHRRSRRQGRDAGDWARSRAASRSARARPAPRAKSRPRMCCGQWV